MVCLLSVRPVTDELKSFLSNWVELGNSYPESPAQCVLSRSTLTLEKKCNVIIVIID